MRLVPNWRRVLKSAWSLRLAALSALFGAAEVAVQVFMDDPPIPRGTFAAIAAFVSFGAAMARVIAQESVSGGDQ